MRKIQNLAENSAFIGELPEGCVYCGPGEKLVLLITGKCSQGCFYCPLSKEKRGKDVIYANELKTRNFDDILTEARMISAKGTGITGGDPMAVPERTLGIIKLLKDTFGEKHHIHLYTAGKFDAKYISNLAAAGLDELRFHPHVSTWGRVDAKFDELLKTAVKSEIEIGAEIPLLPGYKERIMSFARYLSESNVKFLNLNELEFSEGNWNNCKEQGYMQKTDISSAVKGSEELGLQILQDINDDDTLSLNVHYCSAQFKDRQQLTNRIKRRAKNVCEPYQIITDDGTLLMGVIELHYGGTVDEIDAINTFFREKYAIPSGLLKTNYKAKRLEIAPWVLQKLKHELPEDILVNCYIIEEYPTADRLEVERIQLDDFK